MGDFMLFIFFFFLSPDKENDFSLGYCKNSQMSFSLNSYFFQFSGAHIDSYREFYLTSCSDSPGEVKQNTKDWKTLSL